MGLTTQQRMQVRMYLGWSERFHQTDSRLEQAMNALDESQSTDAEAQVITILGQLTAIDTALTNALPLLQAKKVGSIELPGTMQIGMLRSEGRRLAGRIAALLGVEVRHDVFSGAGPRAFAGAGGMVSGSGGNLPPLG
jgi:hypothetical protein